MAVIVQANAFFLNVGRISSVIIESDGPMMILNMFKVLCFVNNYFMI